MNFKDSPEEAAFRSEVKAFVKDGGCYVGICAGCYLASTGYDWSLDLLPAHACAYHFFRVISFRMSSSRSRSATIFFRRPFSCSRTFSRFT